ncbi:hypothetical protein HZA39_04310 [Candidatus Peregrinibacteria bacterium]|nr:hypothetical protein [Candidatus Peregrinibacteria bacterium]
MAGTEINDEDSKNPLNEAEKQKTPETIILDPQDVLKPQVILEKLPKPKLPELSKNEWTTIFYENEINEIITGGVIFIAAKLPSPSKKTKTIAIDTALRRIKGVIENLQIPEAKRREYTDGFIEYQRALIAYFASNATKVEYTPPKIAQIEM